MTTKNEKLIIRKILKAIKKHHKFFITGHVRSDGDCLGSELALARMLFKMGKSVYIMNTGPISRELLFMPRVKQVKTYHKYDKLPDNIDVIFTLDSEGLNRLEAMEGIIREKIDKRNNLKQIKPVVINIDHHPDNGNFGDINWVDSQMSSVGEMMYILIKRSGIGIDKEIATDIYISIDTDTGHFCFESTTPRSHLIAADLLQKGINIRNIYKGIYEDKTYGELQLFVECLRRIKLSLNGRVGWSVLTRQMYKYCGAQPTDSQNYIAQIKAIKGVKIALLFRETTSDPLLIKISVRTDNSIDANKLVRALGGGGHNRAAGLTLQPSLKKACKELMHHIRRQYFLIDKTFIGNKNFQLASL
jgi:bifunctional oligoribonuclease and PAP phosphatase NrnA